MLNFTLIRNAKKSDKNRTENMDLRNLYACASLSMIRDKLIQKKSHLTMVHTDKER
jgi:hypothetical protein